MICASISLFKHNHQSAKLHHNRSHLSTILHTTLEMAITPVQINESKLASCETSIGYIFKDKLLLLQALNNSGEPIYHAGAWHKVEKNDALAILGDARVDAVLCRWWWDKTLVHVKGHWDQLRQATAGNAALLLLGQKFQLDRCVICNGGTTKVSDKMVATAVEAVLGAVYLDGGEAALEIVMKELKFDEQMR